MLTPFAVNSQTFEETVNYINNKIDCCSSYDWASISASKNGDVKMHNKDGSEYLKFNFFTIENNPKVDRSARRDYKELSFHKGISFYSYESSSEGTRLSISLEGYNIAFIPDIQNEDIGYKLMKALIHLRSLCTQEKDLFGN